MYANLRVKIEGEPDPVHCYEVVVQREGNVLLFLDANDGDGSYPIPHGSRVVEPGKIVSVLPDF
jgi:hypothetical protein